MRRVIDFQCSTLQERSLLLLLLPGRVQHCNGNHLRKLRVHLDHLCLDEKRLFRSWLLEREILRNVVTRSTFSSALFVTISCHYYCGIPGECPMYRYEIIWIVFSPTHASCWGLAGNLLGVTTKAVTRVSKGSGIAKGPGNYIQNHLETPLKRLTHFDGQSPYRIYLGVLAITLP